MGSQQSHRRDSQTTVFKLLKVSMKNVGTLRETNHSTCLQNVALQLSYYITGISSVTQLEFGIIWANLCVITMAVTELGNEFYADDRS